MKHIVRYPVFALLLLHLVSCSETTQQSSDPVQFNRQVQHDELLAHIRDLEGKTAGADTLDKELGGQLLKSYIDYANEFRSDTLSADFLFKGAALADALGKYQKAIELLTNFHDSFTQERRRAEAVYLVAFIYDAHLHNPEKATEYYNKVIQLYPDSPWADQARSALHLVNMTEEELLEFLRSKNP